MSKNVLILGATSDMAKATAELYAKRGCSLVLASRNSARLDNYVNDLKIRFKVEVQKSEFDALDFASHQKFFSEIPSPDIVILFFGYLGDQEKAQTDWTEARKILDVNYTSAVSILNIAAEKMAGKGAGTIVGISSVAGDRGRQSNYFYGSAKAGFSAYLSGLRNRLFSQGVHVVTIKPGFIYTKMTEQLSLPPVITGKPDDIARSVYKAVDKKKDVVYVLSLWKWIMLIIKNIPEGIFKKLKL